MRLAICCARQSPAILGATMDKMKRSLQRELQKSPEKTVRLIVRVKGDLTPTMARLAELDATVLHSFHLINALAVSCSAQTALALLQEPWVQAMEEDRRVFIQQPNVSREGGEK